MRVVALVMPLVFLGCLSPRPVVHVAHADNVELIVNANTRVWSGGNEVKQDVSGTTNTQVSGDYAPSGTGGGLNLSWLIEKIVSFWGWIRGT